MDKHLTQKDDSFQVGPLTQELIRRIEAAKASTNYTEAANSLKTLPLTTEEFAVANLRLKNAANYLTQNEEGAARYEAKLGVAILVRFLKNWG